MHPSIETLIEYHQRRLGPEAADTLQEHLVHCSECASLILDLDRFSEPHPPPAEDAAAARLMARQILQRHRADRWRTAAMLAASILVVTLVPLGLRSLGKEGRSGEAVASAVAPEVNLPIASLVPSSSLRGSAEVNHLRIERGHGLIGLVLTTSELANTSDFSLLLIDASGRQLLALRGLRPTPLGTFSLGLPAARLQPGRYRLRLVGDRRSAQTALETYDLVVDPAEDRGAPPPPSP